MKKHTFYPNYRPFRFSYDGINDILEIEGIRYSCELFREFAWCSDLGRPFWIDKREDGILTIHRPDVKRLGEKLEAMRAEEEASG